MDPIVDAELMKALAGWRQAKKDQQSLRKEDIMVMKKEFKKVVEKTKRSTQIINDHQNKPRARTRSGRTKVPPRVVSSDGKHINKGIDDATESFDQSEIDHIKRELARVRQVSNLKFEHLRYLVIDVFLEELKGIQSGKVKSDFHDKYMLKDGECKAELRQEIRSSLFEAKQRDYISGLLQGGFQNTIQDDHGDIKHSAINYVEIVMVYEAIARIVRYVHKFDTIKESLDYIRKKSREASGIEDDDDDS